MQLAVLTYHSTRIEGDDYARNDHVALASDLAFLRREGFVFPTARRLVTMLRTGHVPRRWRGRPAVVLTCDDGADYDFHALAHEARGPQPGFHGLLRKATPAPQRLLPALRGVRAPHMTAFVIASPQARTILDRTCLTGAGRWNQDWWSRAVTSGTMHIANHSWDHLHTSLPEVAQRD